MDASQIVPPRIATSNSASPNFAQLPPVQPQPPPLRTPSVESPKEPAAEFTRLLAVPNSCSTVRDAGPPHFPHPPVDPLCAPKRDCLYTLSPQIGALIRYIRARPLLSAELRKQPLSGGFFTSFDSLLSDLQRAANASTLVNPNQPPVFVCAEISERLDRDVFSLNPRLPRAQGFEAFAALAQNFLATLKTDYDGDLARYSDWLPFAKHYDQQAELEHLREQYEAAYSSDPEQFLRLRSDFIEALSAAEQFRARLLSQTDDLATLEAKVSDLLHRFGEPPITQLVTPEETAALAQLKSDIARLRNTPPQDRGDATKEIRQLTDRMSAFDAEISLEAKRVSIVDKLAKLQAYFNQPNVRARLSPDAVSDLANLSAQIAALSQIGTVPLRERGSSYADKLAAADTASAKVEQYQTQVEQIILLGSDLKALNAKIELLGRNLFDAKTLSDVADLQRSFNSLSTAAVPVPEDQLSSAQAAARAMLGSIDELAAKGRQAQKDAEEKLKALYAYYLSLKICNDRLSGELDNVVEQFRKALAENEKNFDKEYTDKIWNQVASAAGIAAPMANGEPIYQLRQECNNMVAAIPLLFPGFLKPAVPKKDF